MANIRITDLVLGVALCAYVVASYKFDGVEDFGRFFFRDKILNGDRFQNEVLRKPFHVQRLSWKNCGSSSDPVQLKSLTLRPDPLTVPGNITVGFKAHTNVLLKAPVKIETLVKKKELLWIEIPCVANIGSCTYTDICQFLTIIQPCPAVFLKHGIQCRCPYKAGTYTLPPSEVDIGLLPLPEWLSDGDYEITAKMSAYGQPLGCIYVQVSVEAGKRSRK